MTHDCPSPLEDEPRTLRVNGFEAPIESYA